MAALRNFILSWRINSLLFFITMRCSSAAGLAFTPVGSQQVQNSGFQLSQNGSESTGFLWQKDLVNLVRSVVSSNEITAPNVREHNKNDNNWNSPLTFGTTNSIQTQNIRIKRDANSVLGAGASTGSETSGSLLANEITEETASKMSETTMSLASATEMQGSSELPAAEPTLSPSPLIQVSSVVPRVKPTNASETTETTDETSTAENTTPVPPVCPEISGLTVDEKIAGKIEISWSLIPENAANFHNVCVEVISLQNEACKDHRQCFTNKVSAETVTGLCHFNEYNVFVRLQCDEGNWKNSTKIVMTKIAAPTEPTNLHNGNVTNTTIDVYWNHPEFPNGIITNYTIYWKTSSEPEKSDTAYSTSYTVRRLKPYTNYNITVSAWTLAGQSKRAGPLRIKTGQGLPGPPEDVVLTDVLNTTMRVNWSPPRIVNGVVTNYSVYWKILNSMGNYQSDVTSETTMILKNLRPYTKYTVKVSALTEVGEGPESEEKTAETKEGIPDPPEDVILSDVLNTTMRVSWSPPRMVKGVVTNYSVYWKILNSTGNYKSDVTNETTMTLKNLGPYTKYTVKVSASTAVGEGPASEEKTAETKEGIPDAPEDVELSEVLNNTLRVSWSPPRIVKGIITNYSVYWKILNSGENHQSDVTNETTMILQNLQPYTNYIVKVSASTAVGEGPVSEEKIEKTKEGLPDPPENIALSEVLNTTLRVSWSPPRIIKGVITNYSVYWKILNSAGYYQSDVTNETTMLLKNLKPYTKYIVKVSAWTAVGEGPASEKKTEETKEGLPDPPENVVFSEVLNTTLRVSWSPPRIIKGVVANYSVYWKTLNSKEYKQSDVTNETTMILKNLKPYTKYTVKVSAWTAVGEGPVSEAKTEETKEGIPDPPENVALSEVLNTTLRVSWSPPGIIKGVVTNYSVYWKILNSMENYKTDVTNEMTMLLRDLKPFTNYTVKVSAWTAVGEGPFSEEKTEETKEGLPSSPTDFRIKAFTNTTLDVTWQEPETPNGIVRFYTIYWQSADGNEDMKENSTTDTGYVISNLHSFTKYNLTVSATTGAGEGTRTNIKQGKTDVGVPSAPRNGTALYVADTWILVGWKMPEFRHGPIDGFFVCWRKSFFDQESNETIPDCYDLRPDNDYNTLTAEQREDQNATDLVCQYYITNLDPWTTYNIEIQAYNENQIRNVLNGSAELIEKQTAAAVPEEPVLEDAYAVTSTTVSVSWRYIGRRPGPLSYAIYLKADKSDGCTEHDQRNITEGLENGRAEIAGLKPFTNYNFTVFASTPAGSSRSQNTTTVRTKPDVPGMPKNVEVNCSYSSTEASVRWETPDTENGLIEKYLISYKPKNGGNNYDDVTVNVEDPKLCSKQKYEHKLQNLRPEATYKIYVMGKTRDVVGYGDSASNNEQCRLPAGIPPFPKNSSLPDVKETNQQEATFSFSKTTFSAEMGKIRYYAIIVGFSHVIGKPTNGSADEARNEKLPVWNQFWKQTSEIYQATPENWNPFEENDYDPLHCHGDPDSEEDFFYCTIGWEKNCSEEEPIYCNGPLKPGTRYGIKVRGFTAAGFSETSPIFISTASVETSSPIGIIVGLVVLFILVVLIAVAIVVDKRQNYKTINQIRNFLMKKDPSAALGRNQDIEINDISTVNNDARTQPMDFITFLGHVKMMMSDSFLRFSLEYEEIKQNSPKHPCTAAEMEENRPKNRWMNIFPFDRSRVKLLPIADEPSSDYINANYIPGFMSHREYIATQGPLPHTVDDFWRMVWEQGVTMIVMLTQCVERGKKKCEQYWPSDSDNVYYGDLKIQLKSESILSSYCIRIFDLQLGTKQHTVKQMHFTKWPDFGSPESPEDLINFVHAVRDHLPHTNTGPILVHCSAGVGRTGTFIAVDRLLQHIQQYNSINIYNTVVEMRHYRTNMVQTEDQYIYIHKCMRDIISQRLNPRASIYDDDDDDIYANVGAQQATEL